MNFVIFGIGAIGSNLFMNLIKMYPEAHFICIDYDKVEERNLNTQPYFNNHIRLPKVNALQITGNMKNRSLKYTPVDMFVDKSYIDKNAHYINNENFILLDCFDNQESRQILEGIENCLHVGFSPTYTAEIQWGAEYKSPKNIPEDELDICEMESAVPFIQFVVSMATFSIKNYIDNSVKDNYIIFDRNKVRKI